MSQAYSEISLYLQHLKQDYNVQVTIKDYCGFVSMDRALHEAIGAFLSHDNDFCAYMKSDCDCWHRCLAMVRPLYQRSMELKQPFFGICHAGLGECVVPIFFEDTLLGTIHAGFFPVAPGRAAHRIRRSCARSSGLDPEKALALYNQIAVVPTISPSMLLPGLQLLAAQLSLAHQLQLQTHSTSFLPQQSSSINEILTQATEYIRQNFSRAFTIHDLADFCHCSPSYISRLFRQSTGLNFNAYLNNVRMEQAKVFLLHTELSVSDIADRTGFQDPNYFSRVFAQHIGCSPRAFRQKYQQI